MRMINKMAGAVATAALAATMVAGTATAQEQLKLNQVSAALAFPLIGGTNVTTYITLTNVGADDRNLHFNAISGKGWRVTDFDCPVTASETVLIQWSRDLANPDQYRLIMECNQAGEDEGGFVTRVFNWSDGVLFVANETEECKNATCTTNSNDLFGDFVIVSADQGLAYSAEAVPFQGKDPLAAGTEDRDYMFDNNEYAMFPSTLATNFITPGTNPAVGGEVTAEMILFTLDGRANIGSQASLDVVFYDDDEVPTSAHYWIDCFGIVRLTDIDPNFDYANLGSGAGHLYMTVIDTDQDSNVHDNKFGNGNSIRVVGVHGWLVQTINRGGPTMALSRVLAQGLMPQQVDGSDVPTFDAL
jgi:hypothetical protein